MSKVTKEQWEELARSVGLSEQTIEEAWQEALKIRAEEAKKLETTYYHKRPNEESETK